MLHSDTFEQAKKAVEESRDRDEQVSWERLQKTRRNPTNAFQVSKDDRARIVVQQSGCCPICGVDLSTLSQKHVHLDHNHETLEIRGMLCLQCNVAIGFLKVDVLGDTLLLAAAEYIKRPPLQIEKYVRRPKVQEEPAVANEWDFSSGE